jgi:hypothetical protein
VGEEEDASEGETRRVTPARAGRLSAGLEGDEAPFCAAEEEEF